MTSLLLLSYLGAVFGIGGNLLLGFKTHWAGMGFVAFLVSNILWLVVAYGRADWALFTQQLFFLVGSVIGIWKWLIEPLIEWRYQRLVREVMGL